MPETLPFLPVLGIVIVVALVGLYLWARKATKHPEFAAQKEAGFDSFLEGLKKYAPDQADAVIAKIQAVDLVQTGQSAYTVIEPRLSAIEKKLDALLAKLPK